MINPSKHYKTGDLIWADHYALQGWVSQRGSELTVGGVTSDIFSEYLRREGAVYTTPSYTGRIAETFWMHGGQPSGTYVLNYDGFGRLRDGWHYLYGNPTNAWSERNITYDRNGNVLSLLRYGSSGTTPLHNYTISYEGNRALMINGTSWYEYDFNGNVTGDAAREMSIGYNVLNLPSWFNDGQSDLCVFYDYLADGTKMTLHREETGIGLAWLGDIVFNLEEDARAPEDPGDGSRGVGSRRDTTSRYMKVPKGANLRNEGPNEEEESASYSFESTPYSGGRIEANGTGTGLTVRKFVTDHLGSVRAIVTNNTVVERSDYYPFGGRHDNTTLPTLTTNRYGFIGKERQNISSSLDPYIDFGARFYDPLTARWLSPDPLADKYTSLTQYNYCGGDPVNRIDPNGTDDFLFDSKGAFSKIENDDPYDRLLANNQSLIVKDKHLLETLTSKEVKGYYITNYNVAYFKSGSSEIEDVFKFLSDNTSSEWIVHNMDNGYSILGSMRSPGSSGSLSSYLDILQSNGVVLFNGATETSKIHSHPGVAPTSVAELESMGYPSGAIRGDWDNFKQTGIQSDVYFPLSGRVYRMDNTKPYTIRR